MSNQITNIEHFQEFSDNPRESDKQTILGSIKYVEDSIMGKEKGPSCNTLIQIFNQFEGLDEEDDKPKKYIYMRMTKPLLLELALKVLEEIATGEPGRAKDLKLAVKSSKANGKIVDIAKVGHNGEFPLSPEEEGALFKTINEAEFSLIDKKGRSPEVKFSVISPQGKDVAGIPFSQKDPFVTPPSKRSLHSSFDDDSGAAAASGVAANPEKNSGTATVRYTAQFKGTSLQLN